MLTVESAIAAAISLAADHGLAVSPRVIADRSNLVLALDPHPIVARVAMSTSLTRVGMTWLAREIAITDHLHRAGVPVTRPSVAIAPGPHERGGWVVSFWELEAAVPELDASVAGARLADVHRALARFDASRLPEWGVVKEAESILERACSSGVLDASESRRLLRAWDRGRAIVAAAKARSCSFQAVHGDAHFGNVFATTRGPLWTDWEDACVAPVEWDIATLRSRNVMFGEEADRLVPAIAAYDGAFDESLARDLVTVRNLQVIPWLAVFAERQPELAHRARARLGHVPD